MNAFCQKVWDLVTISLGAMNIFRRTMIDFFQMVWGFVSLSNSKGISPEVGNHLKQVHITFCCAQIASGVGVYMHHIWKIGGYVTELGSYGGLLWLFRIQPGNFGRMRISLLMMAAIFNGATVGRVIEMVTKNNLSMTLSTFVGIALLFGCYSVTAMFTQRRTYLYFGGLCFSFCLTQFLLRFDSPDIDGNRVFFGQVATYTVIFELVCGLLLFMVYQVVNNEEIIEEAHHGGDHHDYVKHAAFLYRHFASDFVWLVACFHFFQM